MTEPYKTEEIVACDDATKRGMESPTFRIVCTCGAERKFIFTATSWDVFPCPRCFATGHTTRT